MGIIRMESPSIVPSHGEKRGMEIILPMQLRHLEGLLHCFIAGELAMSEGIVTGVIIRQMGCLRSSIRGTLSARHTFSLDYIAIAIRKQGEVSLESRGSDNSFLPRLLSWASLHLGMRPRGSDLEF